MSDTPTKKELTDAFDVLQRGLGASKRYTLNDIRKMSQDEIAALPSEVIEGAFEEEAAE